MRFQILILLLTLGPATLLAEKPFLIGEPGEQLLADDFEPINERWFFREQFVVEDGVLRRTEFDPDEPKRVFLKDAAFHNVIVRFDFRFEGASAIRLMTGHGGGYNTVTQIFPTHFQIQTAKDDKLGFVPSYLGECAAEFEPETWHTITIEFNGEDVVASLDENRFVVGSHPIVDRERSYFAFQVDSPSAAIDNVRIWANEPGLDWPERREQLLEVQAARPPVERNPLDKHDYVLTRLKDRLHRTDETYQNLIVRHEELQAALHAAYPDAFATHKQLQKGILARKKEIRDTDPRFKEMESAINRTKREEVELIESKTPGLADLPSERYHAKLAARRKQLAEDAELAALVERRIQLETDLVAAFPAAFQDVEELVELRNQRRKTLNDDPEFKSRNHEVAEAWRAIQDYLEAAEPELPALWEARQAWVEANPK